jgi:hypothetical protein
MKRERREPACAGWGRYLRSSSRTPNASASLRVVRGDAIRRSSSKFEIESAEIPLLAESCWRVMRRSSRTLFRLCSNGITYVYPFCARPEQPPRDPRGRVASVDELRADLQLGKLIDKQAEKNGASEELEALWAASVRAFHAKRGWRPMTSATCHQRKE